MGGVDLDAMMAQVQEMQAQMAAAKETLAQQTVQATAGGGMVKVEVSGAKEVLSLEISPEVVDPDDIEMLQDLVLAAVNEGLHQADELAGQTLGGATGGLDLDSLGLGDLLGGDER